jgi:hypothetical protein
MKKIKTNRKIINATKFTINNINFKSKLEARCYLLLKDAGLNFGYEQVTFNLFLPFRPAFSIYEFDKQGKIKPDNLKSQIQNSKLIRSVTYTPDFFYSDDNVWIIIETKGFMNDVYPLKKKLLFKHLSDYHKKTGVEIYFFEPNNISTVKQSIQIIKQIFNN